MLLSEILAAAKASETRFDRSDVAPLVRQTTVDVLPSLEDLTALTQQTLTATATASGLNGWADDATPVPIARLDQPGCDRFGVYGEDRTPEELATIHGCLVDSFAGFTTMSMVRVNVSEQIRKALQSGAVYADFERFAATVSPASFEKKAKSKGRREGIYVIPASVGGRYLSLVRQIMSRLGMKRRPLTAAEAAAAAEKRTQSRIAALAKEGYIVEKVR